MSAPEAVPVCEFCGSRVCLKWSDEKCRHTGQTRTSYAPPPPEPVVEAEIPPSAEPEDTQVPDAPDPSPKPAAKRGGRRH